MKGHRIVWPAPGQAELEDFEVPAPPADAVLRLLGAGRLAVRPMISEEVTPDQAPAVYCRLAETAGAPLGVVFLWQNREVAP